MYIYVERARERLKDYGSEVGSERIGSRRTIRRGKTIYMPIERARWCPWNAFYRSLEPKSTWRNCWASKFFRNSDDGCRLMPREERGEEEEEGEKEEEEERSEKSERKIEEGKKEGRGYTRGDGKNETRKEEEREE